MVVGASVRERFDIFLSYAHCDGEAVRLLVGALEDRGLAVYRDAEEIVDFEGITGSVERGLAHSRALVAYYSATYPSRRACQWELTAAFVAAQRMGDPRRRVLVVNPEHRADHIEPVELRDELFRAAPAVGDQQALAAVAQSIADHVAGLEGLLGEVAPLVPPAWYPEQRTGSARFVGRLGEMWALHSALQASGLGMITGAVSNVAQVRGLGGVGKSLLAEEYALRFGAAYPGGVFWLRGFGHGEGSLDAGQREAARTDQLERLAARVGIDAGDDVQGALGRWLGGLGQPCLWVVDDLASALDGELGGWLAPHPAAKTLITTRSREYDALGGRTELGELPEAEALELLTKRRNPRTDEEILAAETIAAELGYHPLALDVAAAAVRYQPFASFLGALREPSEDWLDRLTAELRDALPNEHERSIARTLSRSIELLGEGGLDFLRLASVLAAAPVSGELVAAVFAAVDGLDMLHAAARESSAVDEVRSLSLAEEVGELAWRVHALVSRTVKFTDPAPERCEALRHAAIKVLADDLVAIVDPRAHARLKDTVAHARELTQRAADPSELSLLGGVAFYDYQRGDYASASMLWQRQLEGQTLLSDEHPGTIATLANLAEALHAKGDRAGARKLHEQVVEANRRVLGEEHPDTLNALSNFAATLWAQGDLAGARALQEQVAEASRRVLGEDHPGTVNSLHGLAAVLWAQGDLAGARTLQERVAEIRVRVLGHEHPDSLISLGNLAATLQAQGDFAAARNLWQQVAETQRTTLGEEHPHTLASLHGLAATLWDEGNLTAGIKLEEQVAEARRRVLGEEHPDTLDSLNGLAAALQAQGDLPGAKTLREEVAATLRRALGEEHPDTLTSLSNLAATLQAQRDLAGARRLHEQVAEARRKVLGEEHPDTLDSLNNVAVTLATQGDVVDARELFARIADTRRRVLGEEHPATLTSLSNLAATLQAQGDLAAARRLHEQVAEARRTVLGDEHPATIISLNYLRALSQLETASSAESRAPATRRD